MREEVLFTLDTPYRQPLAVKGWRFGNPERKSLAVVGALRGNEIQQMYICSQLIRALETLEEEGKLAPDCGVLVIPCANQFSMNVGRRFWAADNTDINRMFPGYDGGETTQRIAARIFGAIQGYEYGVHFTSFYLPGNCLPHARIMETGYQRPEEALDFGLPYILLRNPQPYDTTTLNYNWQIWESNAFSLYTRETDRIDEASAQQAVSAVLRYLSRVGVVKYNCHSGYMSTVINESTLAPVLTPTGGIFRPKKVPGDPVEYGEVIGEILDPLTAELSAPVTATTSGVVFFATDKPLVLEHEIAFKLIRRLHI